MTNRIKKRSPKQYGCPLCDEDSGAIGTEAELREHLNEDHLQQETKEDFINEVLGEFLVLYAYIDGLKHR